MVRQLKEAFAFYKDGCWKVDIGALGIVRRAGVHVVRFVSTTLSSFSQHRCGLHAAGLTYYSILGFVPVLCLLMVCAKTCGVDHLAREKVNAQIDGFITQIETGQRESEELAAAAPREADAAAQSKVDEKVRMARYKVEASKDLAQQVRKFSNETFDRIEEVDLSKLGWFGLAFLAWTVVSTLGQVETSFNEIWVVKKDRPIWFKFPLYLFIVVVLPILASVALSMPILRVVKTSLDATLGATSYTKWVGDALIALITSRLFGFVITLSFASLAFALLLKLMPFHKVGFRSALKAGIVTTLLTGGWMKLCTSAGVGIAKSSAMYGSFAALPILLAWIYMSWQLVLLGSCMTYAFDCVHYGRPLLADS